ncbi:MAG: ATP-dependent 6-phosphofructokinase [Victivallales bacterium]|jgi:6-phosphofructokinase 1
MEDTIISNLGECRYKSPLNLNAKPVKMEDFGFVSESERIRFRHEVDIEHPPVSELLFEKAGPREKIFFDPPKIRAAIVTCGGLCPGLNNVIRSVFLSLHHGYGVREVFGIRYGYQGLNPAVGEAPILLNSDMVDHIHQFGGTIIGASRGDQPIPVMVDFLVSHNIKILFTVGGDGTQRGAQRIAEEVKKRGLDIAVVGIPKTIDNDIMYVKRSFGFTTAADKAHDVLTCAHTEAKSYPNGIGLVKLMGRDSGFIAAGATIASQDVNFTIIPEIPLILEGEKGLLETLKRRILNRKHAVIAVAEGAGQELLSGVKIKDASGNMLHSDIGLFLRDKIVAYFKEQKIPVNMKYIDPSYIIRSVCANSEDSFLCDQYARNAVHAAMAGKTGMIIGLWNGFIHLPISLATKQRQHINPDGFQWNCVISSTGQPKRWG